VEQRGGQVVGSLSYDPKQKEFSVELLSADKWIKDDGLQAVFIPDFAATAVALATQLRHTRADLVLLGGNGWDDPATLAPAAGAIDGAVFVDGFFSSSQRRATQDFVSAYKTAYGSIPDILEAQAFDAAKLVAAAVQTGARSRAQMIAALETPRTFDGAAGAVAVGPQGVQRQLFLLRVTNGTITEVPAGRPPSAQPPAPVTSSSAAQ
jgi:branched-chain amino acid transport system substrate-binding protein